MKVSRKREQNKEGSRTLSTAQSNHLPKENIMRGANNINITGTVVKSNLRALPTQQGQDTLYALDITVAQQVQDGERTSTNYIPATYVNKGLDKLAQRLALGTHVSVDGGFRLERWDEKQEDGTVKKASRTVLRMSRLEVLDGEFATTKGPNGKSEVAYLADADNMATIMGNLTSNPELLKTKEGNLYARATVAVNSKYTRGDEVYERVEYVDVTIWDEALAKTASQMLKGTPVRVSGQATSSGWKTEDGEHRANFGLTAKGFCAISLPTRDEQLAESAKEAPAPEKAPAARNTRRSTAKPKAEAPAEEAAADEMPF